MPKSIRLPLDLEVAIKKLAKEHDRSENAEIIVAVRRYVNQYLSEELAREQELREEQEAICKALHHGQTCEEYHHANSTNGS